MARPKKPHNNPSHRPAQTINWDLVDEMLMAGSPGTEIAPKFSMHPETFYDRVSREKGVGFTEYSQRVRSSGDGNLRLSYYKSALDGNTQLLISLGKERLGYGKSEIADPTGTRDAMFSIWGSHGVSS